MANRQQGEGALVIEGVTYTLVLNTYAWAQAQDHLARASKDGRVPTLEELQQKLLQDSMLHLIVLLWAMLQTHHPEIRTVQDASALIDRGGDAVVAAMLDALGMSAPDPKDLKELADGTKKNSRPAATLKRVGTGDGSISRPARSA